MKLFFDAAHPRHVKFFTTCILLWIFTCFASATAYAQDDDYRIPEQANLVYLELSSGKVVIELAPFMAPNHVARFKQLVSEDFYDGLTFYRVIDGFVAQAGNHNYQQNSPNKKRMKAEFLRAYDEQSRYIMVQKPALLADETGFLHGFAAGRDNTNKLEWLVHCPGVVGLARQNDPDSGTTDFYIIIGQSPRHLDRNMSVFGRVIYGMEHVQKLPRGKVENGGVIKNTSEQGRLLKASLGTEIPANQQLNFKILRTDSETFKQSINAMKNRDNPFFVYPGNSNVDVCYSVPRADIIEVQSNTQN